MYFTDSTPVHRRPTRLRFRLLRWLASRLARREILVNGRLYLDRYYLAGPLTEHAASFWPEHDAPTRRLTWLRRTWYLHRFHTPDAGRDLHDHPWDGRGRILAGAYMEHTLDGASLKCEGDKTHVHPHGYHRISQLVAKPGDPQSETWTLLRVGPVVNRWGFLVDGVHVSHEDHAARPVHRGHANAKANAR